MEQSGSSDEVIGPVKEESVRSTIVADGPSGVDNSRVAAHSLAQQEAPRPALNRNWESHLLLAFVVSAGAAIYVARDLIATRDLGGLLKGRAGVETDRAGREMLLPSQGRPIRLE